MRRCVSGQYHPRGQSKHCPSDANMPAEHPVGAKVVGDLLGWDVEGEIEGCVDVGHIVGFAVVGPHVDGLHVVGPRVVGVVDGARDVGDVDGPCVVGLRDVGFRVGTAVVGPYVVGDVDGVFVTGLSVG